MIIFSQIKVDDSLTHSGGGGQMVNISGGTNTTRAVRPAKVRYKFDRKT